MDNNKWRLAPPMPQQVIATDSVTTDDQILHYQIVVLRDDQIDRIAQAVVRLLLEKRLAG